MSILRTFILLIDVGQGNATGVEGKTAAGLQGTPATPASTTPG